MLNPNNCVSLYGKIQGNVRFLSQEDGSEFAARFELEVKRNYRSCDGIYKCDVIPVKFVFPESQREFAHGLVPGDTLSLVGSICHETYKKKKLFYVRTESIALDEKTQDTRRRTMEGEERVSADFEVNLPLPY